MSVLYYDRVPNGINGRGNRLRVVPILAPERYKASSQFLESNARIFSYQWVGWNSRQRTIKELLASETSQEDQLKARHDARPAFIAVITFKVSVCCCCDCCQGSGMPFVELTINGANSAKLKQ